MLLKMRLYQNNVSNPEETGIIAPYKNQVEALSKEITDIDAATVHKFQGKEKENIIISTVDDEISDFADIVFNQCCCIKSEKEIDAGYNWK